MLQSMRSQRVRYDLATEKQQHAPQFNRKMKMMTLTYRVVMRIKCVDICKILEREHGTL